MAGTAMVVGGSSAVNLATRLFSPGISESAQGTMAPASHAQTMLHAPVRKRLQAPKTRSYND